MRAIGIQPDVLLCRAREHIRPHTIANPSKLPPALIDGIGTIVRGGVAFPNLKAAVSIRRALPHRHVAAVSTLAVLGRYRRAAQLVEKLQEIDRALVALGGKSYLAGHVGYGPREWQEHFGERLEKAIRWMREFDPKHVFRSEGMAFGDGLDSSQE